MINPGFSAHQSAMRASQQNAQRANQMNVDAARRANQAWSNSRRQANRNRPPSVLRGIGTLIRWLFTAAFLVVFVALAIFIAQTALHHGAP